MRVVLQRVTRAGVSWAGGRSEIGRGLLILFGVARGDDEAGADWLAQKCVHLRAFSDEAGQMNLSALDLRAELLAVSQFTLYGDCRKGRRPSFDRAELPARAELLYDRFVESLRASGLRVETGRFGAMMEVSLVNDGPVTFILDHP